MVRRQREQTLIALLPSSLTLRMLGFQVLLVLRWEWETFWPNTTPLPQIQHFAILKYLLNKPLPTNEHSTAHKILYNNGYYIIPFCKLQELFQFFFNFFIFIPNRSFFDKEFGYFARKVSSRARSPQDVHWNFAGSKACLRPPTSFAGQRLSRRYREA